MNYSVQGELISTQFRIELLTNKHNNMETKGIIWTLPCSAVEVAERVCTVYFP
jgi:hypothetical protein